jgi:hypothetical protein
VRTQEQRLDSADFVRRRRCSLTAAAWTLVACWLPAGPARASVILSEVLYHPLGTAEEAESLEFVELYNDEPLPRDLSGYRLEGGAYFLFPEGTVIDALSALVVARDPAALAARHGIALPLGPWIGRLDNGGDEVALVDTGGSRVSSVRYNDRGAWPAAADGLGPSLVLRDPLLEPERSTSWGWSPRRGGTPGAVSFEVVEPEVLLNEVYRLGDGTGWIEVFNPAAAAADLGGYGVGAGASPAPVFQWPPGTVLPPRGFLLVEERELGFALDPLDLLAFVLAPDGERIADARRLEERRGAASDGRYPDGAPRWFRLDAPSPGVPNPPPRLAPLAIHEIHFHPYSEDPEDPEGEAREFVEVLNMGSSAVELAGFEFSAGISYTFPEGTVLAPGSLIVVAKDPARIEEAYGIQGVHGPFVGVLADDGETLRLSDALGNVVDEVRYFDSGSWPRWADGRGPSLELVDPRSDNSLGGAWSESEHSAEWQTYEYTARQRSGDSELHLFLLGAGEALVDDIEVLPAAGGSNLVPSGNFDGATPLQGWVIQGTQIDSRLEPGGGPDGTNALRIVASRRGDAGVNRIERQTTPSLAANAMYTVRFKARWLRGMNLLMTRSWNHGIARVTRLQVPPHGGTPGRPNSRAAPNTGPLIHAVEQSPVLPAAGDPVAVRARVSDPDGVASATLYFRLDGEAAFRSVPLMEDAQDAPAPSSAGAYSARIEGMGSAAATAEFYLEARDGAGLESRAPADAPATTYLFQYDDTVPRHEVPACRLVVRRADLDLLRSRPALSNHHLPATFIYGDSRIHHLAEFRYRGSPYLRDPGVTGNRKGFRVRLRDEAPLRGSVRLTLDEQAVDPTYQNDRIINHFLARAGGIPYGDRRHVHLIVRGQSFGTYEQALTVDGRYLERAFGSDADQGELYKIDAHYEILDNGIDFQFPEFTSWRHRDDKEELRFIYKKRSREKCDDFSSLLELLDLMDLRVTADAVFDARAAEIIDLDLWVKAIAVYRAVEDWDAIGGWTGKNVYLFRHPDGRWRLIPWDHDVSLGAAALQADQHPGAYLYTPYFAEIRRLLRRPALDRKFNAELQRLLASDYRRDVVDPIFDRTFELLRRTSGGEVPASRKSFLSARRTFLLSQVRDVPALTILSGGGEPFTVSKSPVPLSGKAPFAVETFLVNGEPAMPRWIDRETWEIAVGLRRGPNPIAVLGFDARSGLVGSASTTITYEPPPAPFIRGDADGDGGFSVSDAVTVLLHLFRGRIVLCEDAADADDSGAVALRDALYILNSLFRGGAVPPPPFPELGEDPSEDALGCVGE